MPWMGFVKSKNKMAKKIKAKFNVAKISNFGNGGGSEVTLFPSINSKENEELWPDYPNGKIKMHFPEKDIFEDGEYLVTFEKI